MPRAIDIALATQLEQYAHVRRQLLRPNPDQTVGELTRLATLIQLLEQDRGVGRDTSNEAQSLGELVKRQEFPALLRGIRELGAPRAYRLHHLHQPANTGRSVLQDVAA